MTDTSFRCNDDYEEGKYIPKSYRFERDLDYKDSTFDRSYEKYYPDNANESYVYDDVEALVRNKDNVLFDFIKHFKEVQCQRLEVLDSYVHGRNYGISHGRRRIEKNKADYRIAHDYGGYIARFATSYIASKAITYSFNGSSDDGDSNDLSDVLEINRINDIDNLNYELAYDCSVYGRAFEFHYRLKGDITDYIARIEPFDMFVIRDKTVRRNIVCAVHCPEFNGLIEPKVYTKDRVYELDRLDLSNPIFRIVRQYVNPYGDVPVVEWFNNRYREGDFEKVLSAIDAYDAGQSDTANYMSDLNDALLVINGDVDLSLNDLSNMRDANILLLESGVDPAGHSTSTSADYIYKQYDVSGVEAYKSRILDDLHMLSGIPKITDESFNTQSGIAMQYKTFGLRQLKETKVNYFSKALRRRYEIIERMRKVNGGKSINSKAIGFNFHENLPSDVWLEIKSFVDSGGLLSQETLLENTSFTNPKKEVERISSEEDKREGLSAEEAAFRRALIDEKLYREE